MEHETGGCAAAESHISSFLRETDDYGTMGASWCGTIRCTSRNVCESFDNATAPTHEAVCIETFTGFAVPSFPHTRDTASAFSMANRKRRAFKQPLLARMSQHLAEGHRVEKSSTDDAELCH